MFYYGSVNLWCVLCSEEWWTVGEGHSQLSETLQASDSLTTSDITIHPLFLYSQAPPPRGFPILHKRGDGDYFLNGEKGKKESSGTEDKLEDEDE